MAGIRRLRQKREGVAWPVGLSTEAGRPQPEPATPGPLVPPPSAFGISASEASGRSFPARPSPSQCRAPTCLPPAAPPPDGHRNPPARRPSGRCAVPAASHRGHHERSSSRRWALRPTTTAGAVPSGFSRRVLSAGSQACSVPSLLCSPLPRRSRSRAGSFAASTCPPLQWTEVRRTPPWCSCTVDPLSIPPLTASSPAATDPMSCPTSRTRRTGLRRVSPTAAPSSTHPRNAP